MAGLTVSDQARVDGVFTDLAAAILNQTTPTRVTLRGYDQTDTVAAGESVLSWEAMSIGYAKGRDANVRLAMYQLRARLVYRLSDPFDDSEAQALLARDLEVVLDPTLYELDVADIDQVDEQPVRGDPERDGDVISVEFTSQFTIAVGGPAPAP